MIRHVILSALVLLALGVAAAPAWARSLEVEGFHANIEVHPDGTIVVEERIRVAFQGSWNGIFRNIQSGYTYAGGIRGTIRVEVDAIEDGDGNPLEYWEKRRDAYVNLKIRVPGAHNAVRTVMIRYRAQNVVRPHDYADLDFGVQDEFYWNVTGNEWAMTLREASAEIHLPSSVPSGGIQATAFTGRRGEHGEAYELTQGEGNVIRVATTKPLHPGEGLTVAVIFPPGHVAYPTFGQKVGWWFQDNWYVFVPVLFLLFWFLAWWHWGRDPMRHRTIIPEWEPPDGLRPSEVGVLVDDRLDQRDLTAAIVDLAVRGILTIHEEEDDDYRLELHKDVLSKTSLESYEKRLVKSLFEGDATEVDLSSLKHAFVKDLKVVRESILDHLVGTKYFQRRPDKVMERWCGWTSLVLIGLVVLGIWQGWPWPYWALSLVCITGMFFLSRLMPRRTKRGLDALARIKGMEEYLVTAEKERMKELPLDHFETLLPYAIALGVQKRWAKAFAGLYEKPPEWFQSHRSGFDSLLLYYALANMNRSVGSNLMSGPRAASSTGGSGWGGGWSGSGGFSGGFSGGGFGGGGGGGW